MLELLPKTYKIELTFSKDYIVQFKYRQGTFRDLLELSYLVKHDKSLIRWLYNFLNGQCERKIIKKPKKRFNFLMKKKVHNGKISMRTFNLLSKEKLETILDFILNTYGKDFFMSKNDFVPKVKTHAPTSSMIAYILEHTNETVETLLDLSWEQIKYLFDGIVYNANEQTKKGQARNKTNMRMKQAKEAMSDEEALKQVKEMEERRKNRNKT